MRVLFLGGDLRQKYACEFLCQNDIEAEFYSEFILDESINKKIKNSDVLVLPMPISKDGTNLNFTEIKLVDIISLLNKESIVFGGGFPLLIKDFLILRSLQYIDYMDIESFQIQNSLLSAEGAIYYAKEKFDRCIYGSDIAILGFGRIGKILAYLLHSQGAKITVCARKETDFVWSKLIGFDGFKMKISGDISNLNLINNKYDIIFNTIPYWIMDDSFAKSINRDTLIIDIASKPFGIDESLVKKYNLNYYREAGIPGRYAPKSAGEIIGKTIIDNMYLRRNTF